MKPEYKPHIKLGLSENMDAFNLLLHITQLSQRRFMKLLLENVDKDTNTFIIRSSGLTDSEKRANSKAFIALKKLNIVRRIRREHYMVNPEFLIPSGLVMSRAYLQEKYNKLKK